MQLRLLCAALVGAPLLAAPALAQAPAPKEMTVSQSAARQRQKTCGAQWRALPVSEKTIQGPKWPQYFSKCVKRLKEQKA